MARFVAVGGSGVGLRFEVPVSPGPGETVLASSLDLINGGKASNQAIGAAWLGADASIVTAVGSDPFSGIARGLWERHGVGQEGVIEIEGASTMVGTVFVDPSGENRITVAAGALDRLDEERLRMRADVIRSADVCVVSLEMASGGAIAALEIARDAGVLSVLNPAPAPRDLGVSARLLELCDWVTPNETEAHLLTGHRDPVDAATALLRAGPSGVVVTLGERGALVADRSGFRMCPAFPVADIVDTSGAGDAFTTAFALALALGLGPDAAAALGTEAGSRTCQGRGFVEALVHWDAIRDTFSALHLGG